MTFLSTFKKAVATAGDVLTTKGDILSRSSSALGRLGVGSNGKVLTATSGDALGISWETVTVADNSVTLAKMASGTDGNLITYDTNGDPAYVVTGSATNVLTSNGAGQAPTFQSVSAGGSIPDTLYDTNISQFLLATASGASTFGSYQEISSDVGTNKKLLGINIRLVDVQTAPNTDEIELAIGGSGSESTLQRVSFVLWVSGASSSVLFNRTIPDNSRLSWRWRHSQSGAREMVIAPIIGDAS
tara:strand:+ start:494 stop:1225 length:732 start_codon:yes stop_codon:yes gene_type:complete